MRFDHKDIRDRHHPCNPNALEEGQAEPGVQARGEGKGRQSSCEQEESPDDERTVQKIAIR
jgi:hypothetical protein